MHVTIPTLLPQAVTEKEAFYFSSKKTADDMSKSRRLISPFTIKVGFSYFLNQ